MDDDSPYDICVSDDTDAHLGIDTDQIKRAVAVTLQRHQCPAAHISVAVVDDTRIATLNRKYLDHEGPTDVLSFNLSDAGDGAPLEGEIVLSSDTAAREAFERDHSVQAEALLYAVHGTLHLLGRDDQTAEDAAAMHAEENRILTQLGVGPVYGGADA